MKSSCQKTRSNSALGVAVVVVVEKALCCFCCAGSVVVCGCKIFSGKGHEFVTSRATSCDTCYVMCEFLSGDTEALAHLTVLLGVWS